MTDQNLANDPGIPTTVFDTGVDEPVDDLATTTLDNLLKALADRHRRAVIALLLVDSGPLSVETCVDHLHERRPAAVEQDGLSVAVALVHTHLPRLADADVVTYDADRQEVARGPQFRAALWILAAVDTDLVAAGA